MLAVCLGLEAQTTYKGNFVGGNISGNGVGLTNNILTTPVSQLMAPYPLNMAGPDAYLVWQGAWATNGLGTNDNWLTNGIIQDNAKGVNRTMPCFYLTDGTFGGRDSSNNLTMRTNFANAPGWYGAFAVSNNVLLGAYLSLGNLSAAGNPGGGTNIYQDIQFLMSNQWGCAFLANDTTGANASLNSATNIGWFVQQANQAIYDFNSLRTSNGLAPQTFLLKCSWSGTNESVLNPQLYYGFPCTSGSLGGNGAGNGSYRADMTNLQFSILNPSLTGVGHYFNQNAFYASYLPGNVEDTNLWNMMPVAAETFTFAWGYTGDPGFNNGQFTSNVASWQGYFQNTNWMSLYQDGRIYAGSQVMLSTTNLLWHAPLGSPNSLTQIINLHNTNGNGTTGLSSQVYTVNVTNFNGVSNIIYSIYEIYSGTLISNFQNTFTFSVNTNSCNLLKVTPYAVPALGNPLTQSYSFGLNNALSAQYQDGVGQNITLSGNDSQAYGFNLSDAGFVSDTMLGVNDIASASYQIRLNNAALGGSLAAVNLIVQSNLVWSLTNLVYNTTFVSLMQGQTNIFWGGGMMLSNAGWNLFTTTNGLWLTNYNTGTFFHVDTNTLITGNGSGLTNTFNGTTNADIIGSSSAVTNTATKYGTCWISGTAFKYTNYDSGSNAVHTNVVAVTGEVAFPIGPGASVHTSAATTNIITF